MSATNPGSQAPLIGGGPGGPISNRPAPDGAYREDPDAGGELPPQPAGDARLDALKERLKVIGPYVGYSAFFVVALLLFLYWTFPWDRVRDRIIADFEKSQHVPPGGARQTLSIGKLEPSWFTGVVLHDVALTTTPADPSKPSSTLRADEVRVRVSLGSIFSSAKDITISAKALGGTIEGSITHKPSSVKDDVKTGTLKGKDSGTKYDRIIKFELVDLALGEIAPIKDAIGAPVIGTVKGSIDLTFEMSRADHGNGTIAFEIDGFCLPGDKSPRSCATGDPEKEGKVHFKVPALKAVFGSDDFPLPPIKIGSVPVQISVKNGVARIEKMEAKGSDVDFNVGGQVALREAINESDVNVNLQFKFNDSYRKKGDSTAGLLMALESEPKLRAGKRPDGFYVLRVVGLLGGNLQVLGAGAGGAAGGFGMPHSGPGLGLPTLAPHAP